MTAPQLWPTTCSSSPDEAGRPGERRDVGGVVAEPVVTLPVAGLPVTRLVDGDDAATARGERRADPPPHRGRRRHAVDQQQRPRRRVAPHQGRPRDAGRLDRDPLAGGRVGERGRDSAGSVMLAVIGGP